MQVVKGKDFRLYFLKEKKEIESFQDEADPNKFLSFFHAISCDVEFSTSFAKIVTKKAGGGETYLPERLTWSVSGDGLMVHQATPEANFTELYDMWRYKKRVFIYMRLDSSYDSPYQIFGNAYVESLSVQANAVGPATLSYSLKCNALPNKSRILADPDDPIRIFDLTFDNTFE